jgi:predicted amidohydrolase YtcJ
VTINSAWQARQSNIKGSIEVGKLADLVILSGNPTQYHPSSIADISVLTTIKEGKIIYGSLP